MAIISARMKQKSGSLAQLDKEKLLQGEIAVPVDGKTIFVCIRPGVVLELVSKESLHLSEEGQVVIGVSEIAEEYYLSESNEELVNGSWEKICPTWVDGTYIWNRFSITWDDGSVITTSPVIASGLNDINKELSIWIEQVDNMDTKIKIANAAVLALEKMIEIQNITKDNYISSVENGITVENVSGTKQLNNIDVSVTFSVTEAKSNGAKLFTSKFVASHSNTSLDLAYATSTNSYAKIPGKSVWIDASGNVSSYGSIPVGRYYLLGSYICGN